MYLVTYGENEGKIMWKIKYDHVVDAYYSRTSETHDTKAEALTKLRKILPMYPYITASLFQKKDGKWLSKGMYKYRENRKTGRYRIVKL